MATWQTPVTDRDSTAMMTVADMNRITNNINFVCEKLAEHSAYIGDLITKTTWIHNDYVTLVEWKEILRVLNHLVETTNIEADGQADERTTYDNINTVEDLTFKARERMDLLLSQGAANHYVDTEVWTGGGDYPAGIQAPINGQRLRHYVDNEIYTGDAANCGGIS